MEFYKEKHDLKGDLLEVALNYLQGSIFPLIKINQFQYEEQNYLHLYIHQVQIIRIKMHTYIYLHIYVYVYITGFQRYEGEK